MQRPVAGAKAYTLLSVLSLLVGCTGASRSLLEMRGLLDDKAADRGRLRKPTIVSAGFKEIQIKTYSSSRQTHTTVTTSD